MISSIFFIDQATAAAKSFKYPPHSNLWKTFREDIWTTTGKNTTSVLRKQSSTPSIAKSESSKKTGLDLPLYEDSIKEVGLVSPNRKSKTTSSEVDLKSYMETDPKDPVRSNYKNSVEDKFDSLHQTTPSHPAIIKTATKASDSGTAVKRLVGHRNTPDGTLYSVRWYVYDANDDDYEPELPIPAESVTNYWRSKATRLLSRISLSDSTRGRAESRVRHANKTKKKKIRFT